MELPYLNFMLAVGLLLFFSACSPITTSNVHHETLPLPPHSELKSSSFSTPELYTMKASSSEEIALTIQRLYAEKKLSREHLEELSSRLLCKLFQSDDPEVVMMTVLATATCHHPISHSMVLALIRSSHPLIQLTAIQSLSLLNTLETDAMLVEALRSDYPVIRLEAGWYIAQKKIPDAFFHIDALRQKMPSECRLYIPELFALEGSGPSLQRLKQLLSDPDEEVVIQALLAIGNHALSTLSESILAIHSPSPAILEALAYALRTVDSCEARERLTRLAEHPSAEVALQASLSLISLGDLSYQEKVQTLARQGNLFALVSLGACPCSPSIERLPEESVYEINLCVANLLGAHCPSLPTIKKILSLPSEKIVTPSFSPGNSLVYWDTAPLETKEKILSLSLLEESLRRKEYFLSLALDLEESDFIDIASHVFHEGLIDLYPSLVQLLTNKGSDACISLLTKESLRLGAPLNRAFATLGLIKLGVISSEKELLPLLQFSREKEVSSWRFPLSWTQSDNFDTREPFQQTTVTARLYIEILSTLAENGSPIAVQMLADELSLAPQKYLPFVVSSLTHAIL